MQGRALSPSPIALFLLGLAERGADGSVEVGGRRILLRKGQVVDIRPAEGDGDLVAFLRDSGRVAAGPLERCAEKAREEGVPLADVLVRQRLTSPESIRDVTRRLWLDRLVRGMARATAEGREPAPLQADVRLPASAHGASLVTLVLDALERRAADEDAGYVGARASHRLEWLPGPHLERARRWARFDPKLERPAVAALLTSEPAAAPRIAALVRAGLARIVSPDAPPAPAPRVSSIPVTSPPPRHTPPLGSPSPRSSLPPRKRPSVQLDPGLSPIFDDAPELDVELPELPEARARLDDPLDRLERTIAGLEQRGAPGAERAEAWRRFAEQWEERFGSLEEAARAYREAAAADDGDPDALARASDRCAALGQADLAVAYARAAVTASPEGPERAAALWRHALSCRRLGKLSEALGAARAAAAAAPEDPAPLALAVSLFRELGRPADAAEAALEAAARLRPHDPARALSLVAVAQGLDPRSPERAEAYAAELADNGLVEAAIAVRADGVRRTADPEARRALLLAAAEQAEVAERPALAAALLTRAFDADPHLEVLYEPLAADLAQAGDTLERAVLLEEIAAAAPEEVRSQWLQRAAEARLDLPGDGAWEAELRARALELEPENEENLQFVRDQAAARDDDRLLADTLERALARGRWSGAGPQARMLEELARLAEESLDAPVRAAWAWERLAAIDPDAPAPTRQLERLAPALEEHAARRAQLEEELRAAEGEARVDASLRLADHLRDDPERRSRALGLYRDVLDTRPDDPRVADAVERLYRLVGDEYHEARTLALRAEHAATPAERRRFLAKLAALHVMRRDLREAAIASQRILEETPGHREASLRLRRAASRLRDRELLREALAAEIGAALPARQRARILTALAMELEVAGSVEEAISCAEAALTDDPRSAEAALLVSRHLAAVEQPRAALGVVRALFGDSPPVLEAWARVARDSGEREVMLEALDGWARVAPYDPEPWAMRLTAFPSSESNEELAAAIDAALAPERVTPRLARPVARAIERLGERAPERAAELAVRAADALGPHGDALRELAGRLAASTGAPALRRAALERCAATQIEDARVELLHELAELHREVDDPAAEARTHLRILATRPGEPRALARLERIYAETGEVERLMAVLTLELEAAEAEGRLTPLLKLASASAQLRGDLDRAEAFLRDAWSPSFDDDAPLFAAAAALVRLGRARRAVEHLRDAGRRVEAPRRSGPIFLRAVQTALKKVGDPRLALSTAIEGLDHAPGSGGLLVAFEQLALELTDVDLAERTYRSLIERAMGPHGRRALSYRRARWLERAGATRAALSAYLEAFEQHPQAGAVYSSIERLAREQGDLAALVKAARVLGERANHPAIRAKMAREAAAILEGELADPEQAFEVLAELWEHGGHTELEDDLVRLAAALRARSPERGEAAFGRLLGVLRERAEDAWMAEAKARLLLRVGRLHAVGRDDLLAATSAVDEALSALRDEGGDADLVADLSLELASWIWEGGDRDAAGERVRDALRAKPSHEGALALAARLGLVIPESPAEPEGQAAEEPGIDWGAIDLGDDGDDAGTVAGSEAEAGAEAVSGSGAGAGAGAGSGAVSGAVSGAGAVSGSEAEAEAGSEAEAVSGSGSGAGAGSGVESGAGDEAVSGSGAEAVSGSGAEAVSGSGAVSGAASGSGSGVESGAGDEAVFGAEAGNEAEAGSGVVGAGVVGAGVVGAGSGVAEASRRVEVGDGAAAAFPEGGEDVRAAEAGAAGEPAPNRGAEPAAEPPGATAAGTDAADGSAAAPASPAAQDTGGAVEASGGERPAADGNGAAPSRSRPDEHYVAAGDAPGAAEAAGGVRAAGRRPSVQGWSPAAPPEAGSGSAPTDLPWVTPAREEVDDAALLERQADKARRAGDLDRSLDLLRSAVATAPSRLSTVAKLAEVAERAEAHRTARVARSLLALVDPSVERPEPLSPPAPTELRSLLRDATWSANRELWSRLWEHALPLFRENPRLPHLNDRVTRVATTPESRAFSAALDALGLDELPVFYFDRTGEPTLVLARTAPPSIVGGPGFAPDEPSMRFALGRMLELSRPEHVLPATLPEPRARVVVAAVTAAFGPADGEAPIDREAAAVASELWRTIPARSQAEVRELLLSTDRWSDFAGTRSAVLESAARAGLVAAGDLGAALRMLADEPLDEPAQLTAALERPELARLVRFALTKLGS